MSGVDQFSSRVVSGDPLLSRSLVLSGAPLQDSTDPFPMRLEGGPTCPATASCAPSDLVRYPTSTSCNVSHVGERYPSPSFLLSSSLSLSPFCLFKTQVCANRPGPLSAFLHRTPSAPMHKQSSMPSAGLTPRRRYRLAAGCCLVVFRAKFFSGHTPYLVDAKKQQRSST